MEQTIFSPYRLGALELKNRMVMAPMTRSRAISNIPNNLMAEYYSQRASAGLIITEGTSPSPNGLGYARIPGIFSDEQVDGWKTVTGAVHQEGGKIFLQLMHTGRIGHPLNLPKGGQLLAPSEVKPETTQMWVDGHGMLEIPAPAEMSEEDIEDAINEHVIGAINAIKAGFDGVEIHGANGYLIKQFLNPHTNRRKDAYGGSVENRSRFLLEIAARISQAIGKEKVGVRVSPFSTFNETKPYAETGEQYFHIARELNKTGIVYLHFADNEVKGKPADLVKNLRREFHQTILVAGGYGLQSAENAVREGHADLVAFARNFLANPDLLHRFKNNLPLNLPKFDLFYTPGSEGYSDYPSFKDVHVFAQQ